MHACKGEEMNHEKDRWSEGWSGDEVFEDRGGIKVLLYLPLSGEKGR